MKSVLNAKPDEIRTRRVSAPRRVQASTHDYDICSTILPTQFRYTYKTTPHRNLLDLGADEIASASQAVWRLWSEAMTGLPGCMIMRHQCRIVSIHHRRVPIMRTIAWVIILAVIAANEPSQLLRTILALMSTLMHLIGL